MTLTFYGHSAVLYEVAGKRLYIDPYFEAPVPWSKLPKADYVLFTHGHFDHGVLLAPQMYEEWKCKFVAPKPLARWMLRKYRKKISPKALIGINEGDTVKLDTLKVMAVPAHHPINRLGKTILSMFARNSSPGKPVLGYYFNGYYHSGDTVYTKQIAIALKDLPVHTACLPIGGKYAIASPTDALRIAEEIGAIRVVPIHWQPLANQIFFRYQPSDLVKLAKAAGSKVAIKALANGQLLEEHHIKSGR